MKKYALLFTVLFLYLMSPIQTKAQTKSGSENKKNNGLSIVVTSLDINDKTIELNYELINNSKEDFWILVETTIRPRISSSDVDVFMSYDNQTLVIRRRRDLPYNIDTDTLYGI